MHATNRVRVIIGHERGHDTTRGYDIAIPCHYLARISAVRIITINDLTRARRSHQRRRYNLAVRSQKLYQQITCTPNAFEIAHAHTSPRKTLASLAISRYRVPHLPARPRNLTERESQPLSRRLRNSMDSRPTGALCGCRSFTRDNGTG